MPASSSSSLKSSLPTTLICRMRATLAFGDVHVNIDEVSGLLLHLHVDVHVIAAAREVLVDEVLAHVLEHVAIEDLAAGETDVAQRLRQVLGLDGLVALDVEGADRRPLLHHHHQSRFVAAQLHVAEEAGVIERAQRLANPLRADPVADVDGQRVEHRAFTDALQPLDADVGDLESSGSSARAASALTSKVICSSRFITQYDRQSALRFVANCYGVLRNVTASRMELFAPLVAMDTEGANGHTKTHTHSRRRSRGACRARRPTGDARLSGHHGQQRRRHAARARARAHRSRDARRSFQRGRRHAPVSKPARRERRALHHPGAPRRRGGPHSRSRNGRGRLSRQTREFPRIAGAHAKYPASHEPFRHRARDARETVSIRRLAARQRRARTRGSARTSAPPCAIPNIACWRRCSRMATASCHATSSSSSRADATPARSIAASTCASAGCARFSVTTRECRASSRQFTVKVMSSVFSLNAHELHHAMNTRRNFSRARRPNVGVARVRRAGSRR